MNTTIAFVDGRRVRQSFARAAGSYASHDFFAREIDRRMQARLDYVKLQPELVLDLGCSQGGSLAGLRQRYGEACVLGVDFSPEMLLAVERSEKSWRRWLPLLTPRGPLCAAAEATALPLRSGSAGLVWSNLLLHWLNDPLPALAEAHRVMEVGGLFMFSTLGPDTLKELRLAFNDSDAHTQRFADMHDLGDMLIASGFSDPVMDMEVLTLTYDSLPALLGELRASGSRCAMQARRRGLFGKKAWQSLLARYQVLEQEGRLPATFEVVYGHAWKPAPRTRSDGRSIVRFSTRPEK